MSENTIHSGKGTQRGIILSVAAIAIFVVGAAMLGSGSAPDDAAPAAAASE